MPDLGSLGGGLKGGANERPFHFLLTESWSFDMIHRRAGGTARPGGYTPHADSHKYCALGRCGNRPGPYEGGYSKGDAWSARKAKITRWRKAKALANRRYLEENVYGNATKKGVV